MENRQKIYFYIAGFALLVILTCMSILKENSLHSTYFDLGIYKNIFWKSNEDFSFSTFFFGHAMPIAYVETLIYKIFPNTLTLIFIQTLIICSSYFLLPNMEVLTRGIPVYIISISFCLYFPIWYNALFDFHIDHLSILFIFLFYYACYKDKFAFSALSAILTATIKEPYSLVTIFCGIYLIIRWKRINLGIFLIIFGSLYFYFTAIVIIPHFNTTNNSALAPDAYAWLGGSPLEIFLFIIKNPVYVFNVIVTNYGKVKYIITLFGALSFISFFGPLELIPAIPIILISILSKLENYYGIANHYTAGLIAPVIISFFAGYTRAEKLFSWLFFNFKFKINSKKVFAIGITICIITGNILLSPSPLSKTFWENKVWSYGYQSYFCSERDYKIKKALKEYIPEDKHIAVTTQNTINTNYISNRKYYFPFPVGAIEPYDTAEYTGIKNNEIKSKYVIIDIKRPWYIKDKGCNYKTNNEQQLEQEELKIIGLKETQGKLLWNGCASKAFRKEYFNTINIVLKNYYMIYAFDGFLILKAK